MQSVQHTVKSEEWTVRVNLAACYRIIAHYGWDDLIFTHITARVPGPDRHFLINPYGMGFDEITASSLIKVDLHGNQVMASPFDINPAGFLIHSAVHEARQDAHCVIHLHTNAGVAVSAQRHGLLPISQQSLLPYADLAYHDYEGIALNTEEKARLVSDLGQRNFMILRNHGLLTCAETIQDAFLGMYLLNRACEIQLLAQNANELISVNDAIIAGIGAQAKVVLKMAGGGMAWPSILRKLDRVLPGYNQ